MDDSLKMIMAPPPGRGSVGGGATVAWSASPRAPAPPQGVWSRRWGPAGRGSPPQGAGWWAPGPCSSPSGNPNPWRDGTHGEMFTVDLIGGGFNATTAQEERPVGAMLRHVHKQTRWRLLMCHTFSWLWLVADCLQRDSGRHLLITPLGIKKKQTETFQTNWSDDVS